MKEKTIIITKEEYEHLIQDSKELDALYSAGVDNWEGYEEAQNTFAEGE